MKKVLMLTDFSDTARNAAMYALKMFEDENVHYSLLNAFDLEFSGSPYIMQVREEMAEESRKGLKNEMSLIRRRFPNAQLEMVSRFGSLLDVIHQELNESNYELVVLGCRGETVLENFLLGSNAYEVIKNVMAPVLVVPKHAKFKKPDKVVFATDLRDIKHEEMVKPLKDVLGHYNASLLFVNVLEDDYVNRLDSEENLASHFPGVNLSFNFIEGDDVSKGILKFMDDNEADIVTMIRHNTNFFERLFHPSITKQMVLHPEHPMLILHDDKEI